MTMKLVSVIFTFLMILLNVWFSECESQKDFQQVFSEEDVQLNNIYDTRSGIAASDNRDLFTSESSRFLSGADAHRRKKRELSLSSFLSSSIGLNRGMDLAGAGDGGFGLNSGLMFTMGSNRGVRNGQTMSFGNNGMKNRMMSTTSNESPMVGMGMFDRTNTNLNDRMHMQMEKGSDFISKMGSSMPINRNFNSAFGSTINDEDAYNRGMGMSMENNRAYQSGSVTSSNTGLRMGNGFTSNAGSAMSMGGNAGWNAAANLGNNAGMDMQHNFGAGSNNNMKLPGGSNTAGGTYIMP